MLKIGFLLLHQLQLVAKFSVKTPSMNSGACADAEAGPGPAGEHEPGVAVGVRVTSVP